jgi:hypothetical protein
MYRAKSDGRNGIAFFETAMQAEVEQRLTLERDLAPRWPPANCRCTCRRRSTATAAPSAANC